MSSLWGLAPVALVLLAYFFSRWRRRRREHRLSTQPFPEPWSRILRERMTVYKALREEERRTLEGLIKRFLDEKTFYGCAGLEVTECMKLRIAAESCLLLLGQSGPVYPKLKSILVYPTGFIARRDVHQDDGTVAAGEHHLLGESWNNGRVILSWDDVEEGVRDFTDGHNVVLHEFAHQLDSESGGTNGAPPLRRNSYQTWARVFSDNFEDLRSRVMHGKATVMDPYGSSNPAEFFAVATETFFEKPHDLVALRPELFEELQLYYRVDPREWHSRMTPQAVPQAESAEAELGG
jgi:Mlc titration factor MtfA (ptsG expression regulator)